MAAALGRGGHSCDATRPPSTQPRDPTNKQPSRAKETTLERAIEIVEAYVLDNGGSSRVRDAWKQVQDATKKSTRPNSNATDETGLSEVKTQIKELTEVVQNLASMGPKSYATAAKTRTSAASTNEAKVPVRNGREVNVRPGKESLEQNARSGVDLVRDITQRIGAPGLVVAARRLPSGDVTVSFDSAESKSCWENRLELREAFGQDAAIQRRGHPILVHGVRTKDIDITDQALAARTVIQQNPKWNGLVDIARIAWPAKVKRLQSEIGSLVLSVASPQQANLVIQDGLLLGCEYHNCEVFSEECRVTRCFNCQLYHRTTAKHCRNQTRCGFCAGAHRTEDCLARASNRLNLQACRACGKSGHPAWAKECLSRRTEVSRARQAFLQRPRRYQDHLVDTSSSSLVSHSVPSSGYSSTPAFSFTTPTVFPPTPSSNDDGDFQVVRPRKRGRPSALEVAARTTHPITSSFHTAVSATPQDTIRPRSDSPPPSTQTTSVPSSMDLNE